MLSIGKLSKGHARYYLDQAKGRVDVVESIGDGLEDYYTGGAEARGEWIGAGARELGLRGNVDAAAFRALLDGHDPEGDRPLRDPRSRTRLSAFDLTFSAPKSVSVVFAVGDPRIRAAVRGTHDRAVAEALGYLERSAAVVRRGAGGAQQQRASGFVAAAFRHRTSRSGDPQLHTHVVIANLGRGPDGRWSALDGRLIYAHARVASFIYQAVLRGELSRTLGLEWTAVRDGIAEIRGVPPGVLRVFSRRRAEITAALAKHGRSGERASEVAALATRRSKRGATRGDELAGDWRRRAAAAGFTSQDLERLLGVARGRPLDRAAWARLSLSSPHRTA